MATTKEITRNLGGDRLGSGSKNNVNLHAYNRSTHDLSRAWRSSMTVGTLVPFCKILGLNGDTFSVDLDSIVRTLPSKAPLFGGYKLQIDMFNCPIRLYNGLLHNNMTKIGLNMAAVKLPKMNLKTKVKNRTLLSEDLNEAQIASDSLLGYLGLRGIGDVDFGLLTTQTDAQIDRNFNAVPLLAYWDIVKNYYANKQEEKGVFICQRGLATDSTFEGIVVHAENNRTWYDEFNVPSTAPTGITLASGYVYQSLKNPTGTAAYNSVFWDKNSVPIDWSTVEIIVYHGATNTYTSEDPTDIWVNVSYGTSNMFTDVLRPNYLLPGDMIWGITHKVESEELANSISLKEFPLSNIDDARIAILQDTGLNNELMVNSLSTPYSEIVANTSDGYLLSKFPLHGLAVKTYQSDLLNNWLQTEWIDGANGINKITAVDTSSGSFEIDALNLANKVYNMLNRVAVSGGSFEDWQEAVFSVEVARRAESPIYCGGLSAEIMFNEVVSHTATEEQALGSLAGKGAEFNKKGGHLEIYCSEPSYVIGIVSITPRLDYSQGNDWDITELDTLNDVHKPALDGIGFEDLLQERAAYWGTIYDMNNRVWRKLAIGKTPAWINYMTAINETHGDFARENAAMFMTLNRRYQFSMENSGSSRHFGITDLTSYIDPAKYNYIFANASLDSQNFWVQIGMGIEARRVMSAKILPNL